MVTPHSQLLTITARDLVSGGVLLTINDDRRIEVHGTVAEVRAVLSGSPPRADQHRFLVDLARLVEQAARSQTPTPPATRRLLVHIDDVLARATVRHLVNDLGAALSCPVEFVDALALQFLPGDILVTLHDHFDFERLTRVADAISSSGARWAPFWMGPHGGRFGPYQTSVSTPTVRDLAARWVAAASKESHGRALLQADGAVFTSGRPSALEVARQVAVFLDDVASWLAGSTALGSWHSVRLSRGGDVAADPVLPLPDRDTGARPDATGLTPMDVLNTRTGIVTRLREVTFRTPMPPEIRYVESQTADMARLTPWASNIFNAGSSWGDDARARAGAVGEAVERYCGNVVDHQRLLFDSYVALRRRGMRAVDPDELVLFSDAQYDDPRFPFVKFSRDTPTHWVRGRSLVDESEVLVPAALTYVNWNTGRALFSPRTNPAYYPGIAAGASPVDALANALEEVVERDASMVWWWSGHALPAASDGVDLVGRRIPNGWCEEHGVKVQVTPLSNAVGLPVVAVSVEAVDLGLLTVGLAARSSGADATDKALLEALGLLESALDMQDPDGGFWRTYQPGQGNGAVRPVRSDRRYLDSYRSDFRDVTDLFCQLQVQLDARSRRIAGQRFGGAGSATVSALPHFPERDYRAYVAALASHGFEALEVDLTTPDVAAAGWHVRRVVVPGLAPNFPTAFPPLGRRRLQDLPMALGWRETPLSTADLWSFPMPYA